MIDKEQTRIVARGDATRRWLPIHDYQDIPDSLARLGIRIRYFRDERYQSFLEWDTVHKEPIIALNVGRSLAEQHRTILHELGHLLIEYHWSPDGGSRWSQKCLLNVEYPHRDCNAFTDDHGRDLLDRFAVTYLIPTRAIRHILRDNDLDYIELIRCIAERFVIPLHMARTRLAIFLAVE